MLAAWLGARGVYAAPADIPPVEPAASSDTVIQPASVLELRVSGFLHSDWVVHRQSSLDELDPAGGAPLNQESFLLRRGRLALDARRDLLLGHVSVDVNSVRELTLRPFEAYVGASVAPLAELELSARLGLQRIPFGFDAIESPLSRPVLERTNATRALFPGQRDLGIGAEVRYGAVKLQLALMNGAPVGEFGPGGVDLESGKDIVGHIGVEAQPFEHLAVSAGLSGLSGHGLHAGTPATKDGLAWSDGNEDGFVALSELTVIPGSPATASSGFSRFALGADARVRIALPVLGELQLRAEIVRAKNLDRGLEPADPVASGRDLRELGFLLGGALELTRWAQLGVQYDEYRPDDDARRAVGAEVVPLDARYSTLAFALAARLPPLRLLAEYDHNDNPLGRAANGSPARLRDDAFILRGELTF